GAEQPRAFWYTIFDAFRSDVRDARLRCPAAGDAACSPLHEGPETEEDGDQVDRPAHERHEVEERKRDQTEYQHAEARHAGLRLAGDAGEHPPAKDVDADEIAGEPGQEDGE